MSEYLPVTADLMLDLPSPFCTADPSKECRWSPQKDQSSTCLIYISQLQEFQEECIPKEGDVCMCVSACVTYLYMYMCIHVQEGTGQVWCAAAALLLMVIPWAIE